MASAPTGRKLSLVNFAGFRGVRYRVTPQYHAPVVVKVQPFGEPMLNPMERDHYVAKTNRNQHITEIYHGLITKEAIFAARDLCRLGKTESLYMVTNLLSMKRLRILGHTACSTKIPKQINIRLTSSVGDTRLRSVLPCLSWRSTHKFEFPNGHGEPHGHIGAGLLHHM